jgi:hypothetical protein
MLPYDSMRVLHLVVIGSSLGCGSAPARNDGSSLPITPPSALCRDRSMDVDSFCLDAERMERVLMSEDYSIVHIDQPGRGTSGVKVLTLEVSDRGEHIRFRAKWKPADLGGEGFNNSPRREVAAYALQKLFLEPAEYVVPPTGLRCVPLERFRRVYDAHEAMPTFEGTRCVLGTLTYWVENLTDRHILDRVRFQRDAAYRRHIVNLNLFAYLIDHHDPHDGNFLFSTDPERPRAFSIDNGFSFGGFRNPMPYLEGDPIWSRIIVPALSKQKIDILRTVTREHLDRLATVALLVARDDLLVPLEPGAPFDPREGVRVSEGFVVQLGLTEPEIDGIQRRIAVLLRRVNAGEIALFDDSAVDAISRAP